MGVTWEGCITLMYLLLISWPLTSRMLGPLFYIIFAMKPRMDSNGVCKSQSTGVEVAFIGMLDE